MACIDHQQTLPTVNPPNYPGVQYQNAPYSDHINSVQFHTLPPAISAVAFPASAPPSNGNRMSKKKKYFFIALLILVLLVIIISLILIAVRIGNAEKDSRWRQPETSCYGIYTLDAPIGNIGISKEIYMPGSDTKLNVYCDGSDGGGWIVIQYRPGTAFFSTSFEKQWTSYEQGFGDKNGYWIGLKKLHELTSATDFELRIDMEDYCGSTAHATYSNFKIAGTDEKYKLTVGGYDGNSTDSLSSSNGNVFSIPSTNVYCSTSGGWWFSDNDNYFNCRDTNLNGKSYSYYDIHEYTCYSWRLCDCVRNGYRYNWESNYMLGSFWDGFGGGSGLIKATKMRIRPKFL